MCERETAIVFSASREQEKNGGLSFLLRSTTMLPGDIHGKNTHCGVQVRT